MHPISTKNNDRQHRNRILPSKPSKQSLIARGLAVDEKAASRILNKNTVKRVQKPGFSFYNSSDSDADQVYSVTKKLDRCASLLNNILEEKENVPKKKTNLKTKPNLIGKKTEKKKVVKIVLPSHSEKEDNPGQGRNGKPSAQVTRKTMITSTPTMSKRNSAKNKEEELKKQLSEIEKEKHILQEQYSTLLQKQLSTPVSHLNANNVERKQKPNTQDNQKCDVLRPYRMQLFPAQSLQNRQYPDARSEAEIDQEEQYCIEKEAMLLPIFRELENTVNNISDKLSFPGSLTPSSRSIFTDSDTSKSHYTSSLSNNSLVNEYQSRDQSPGSKSRPDEGLSRSRSTSGFKRSLSPYLQQNTSDIAGVFRKPTWPVENSIHSAYTDSVQPASSLDNSRRTDNILEATDISSEATDISSEATDTISEATDAMSDERGSVNSHSSESECSLNTDNEPSPANSTIVASNSGTTRCIETSQRNTQQRNSEYSTEEKSLPEDFINTSREKERSNDICIDNDHVLVDREFDDDNVQDGKVRGNALSVEQQDKRKVEDKQTTRKDDSKFATEIGKKAMLLAGNITEEVTKVNDTRKKNKPKTRKINFNGSEERKVGRRMKKRSSEHKTSEEINLNDVNTDAKYSHKPTLFISPDAVETKPLMEVTSQLASLKESDTVKKVPSNTKITRLAEQPRYAATQITMLSYLFKELFTVLGDKLNSEEERLLTEIDHIIGLLPFLMNNLNPDLQTEISIAVQPLRVENSDLRRQLRIANQKMRELELQTNQLGKELTFTRKRTIDEDQLAKLKNQITIDGEQRKMFIEKIAGVTKVIEELKLENINLVQKLADKDAEDIHKVKLLQKEKSALASENSSVLNKLESLSLTLQAQQKENKILQLSISQSEAEIARVKELNRGLQESVANLLQDVNFKDTRLTSGQIESKKNQKQIKHDIGKGKHNVVDGVLTTEKCFKICSEKTRDTKRSMTTTEYCKSSDNTHTSTQETSKWKSTPPQKTTTNPNDLDIPSDIASEALSSTMTSESERGCTIDSTTTSCNDLDSCFTIDDRYSILTCDSGEFRLNLANLDADIKKLQLSLQSAKTK